MSNIKECKNCNGEGTISVLVSQHDNKTEIIECPLCNGKGSLYVMTDKEEDDYHADYW